MSKYHNLVSQAAQQHGVFSRQDARDLGVARSSLASGVKAGRFIAPAPGVFIVAGSPDTQMQRMSVAVLSMPGLAAISHDTAAEMWGLTRRGIRSIHIVTRRWDRVDRPGATIHESLDLIESDVVLHDGILVTSPERTVVDLGASNKWIVESALEEGIRCGLFVAADVEGVVHRVGRKGRRGVGVVRPLLQARRKWDGVTESALEDLFRKTIDEMGLPNPQPQYVVRDDYDSFVCRADFAYPRSRVLVELDSEAHHLDRITFRRDRSKQNKAVALGWIVLRFTWWDLQDNPYQVGAQVEAALAIRQLH